MSTLSGVSGWEAPVPELQLELARSRLALGAPFGASMWMRTFREQPTEAGLWDGRLGLGIHMLFRGEDGECVIRVYGTFCA